MALGPEIPVRQSTVKLPTPKVRNAAKGQKLPWYLAAARTKGDRNYEPRNDLD